MDKSVFLWHHKWHFPLFLQINNYRQIHRLNYQWQAGIHFNWPIVGQYGVIYEYVNILNTIPIYFTNLFSFLEKYMYFNEAWAGGIDQQHFYVNGVFLFPSKNSQKPYYMI